jgi:hypothetical protein
MALPVSPLPLSLTTIFGLPPTDLRIRTSVWWNQNQAGPSTKSMRILKKA